MPTKAAASDVKEPLGDGVKKEERKEEARDVAGFLLSLKTGDTSPKPDDDTDEDDSPPDEKNVEKGKTVALDESTPENVAETEDSPYQEIGQEILKKDIEEAVNSAAEETLPQPPEPSEPGIEESVEIASEDATTESEEKKAQPEPVPNVLLATTAPHPPADETTPVETKEEDLIAPEEYLQPLPLIPVPDLLHGPVPSQAMAAPENNVGTVDMDFRRLLGDSTLVSIKDRDLVPDSLFVAMGQMKTTRLTQADRVGCYKTRDIGFMGMCCKHCGGQPGFGRYFPNSVRSLAQTTTSQTILKHIGSKCRFCPPDVREAVLELQRIQAVREGMATGRPRYGSRKIFFQRVWARLHAGAPLDDIVDDDVLESTAVEATTVEADRVSNNEEMKRIGETDDATSNNKKAKVEVDVTIGMAAV